VIAQAARFYAAYNAGELTTVMSILSANPTLSDCDYENRALVSINGRPAIENCLRARFADHDRWTVELYQERPTESRQIVIVPLQRQNGMLLKLDASGGVKRSFAVLLSLQFEQEQRNIDMIQWGTVMGPTIERELCSP
jgi:hypothetical protein